MDTITIEDDDGFTTSWSWPEGHTMLANAGFVRVFEELHERVRAEEQGDD